MTKILTPHAKRRCWAPMNVVTDGAAISVVRFESELRNLRAKWADVLVADPFYNPALSLNPRRFRRRHGRKGRWMRANRLRQFPQ
jgi:hypothetical protein